MISISLGPDLAIQIESTGLSRSSARQLEAKRPAAPADANHPWNRIDVNDESNKLAQRFELHRQAQQRMGTT